MQTRRRKYNEEDKATAELAVEKGKAAKTARLRMPQFQHLVSVFVLFSISRLISALFNNINDCDETFNYWEPAHFLLYGNGFQTWEYSPEYAIRSYFYIWLYVIPASVATFLGLDKMSAFYLTRFILAFFSALVETFFYSVISRTFNHQIAIFYCLFSLFAPGMFNSATSFLPSSFGQTMVSLAVGFWMIENFRCFIFFTAFNAIVGWPFTAVICLPMALCVFLNRRFTVIFIIWSICFGLLITILTVSIDSYYYGKFVFASLNIVLYNVFSTHGPELYGTEPLSYYLYNLFLNFNVAFLLSLCSVVTLLGAFWLKGNLNIKASFSIAALYLWYFIFFLQAHKEERFMYPVYPLISLAASLALFNIQQIVKAVLPKLSKLAHLLTYACLALFIALSLSRTLAVYKGYGASLGIYTKLSDVSKSSLSDDGQTVLCLAKEWHRFPSNFFIPEGVRVEFIPSEFRGQLPKHYDASVERPTRAVPALMNDQNQEEVSRYISLSQCDLIIDSDYTEQHGRDLAYSKDQANWSVHQRLPFLDATRSSNLLRAFYIPILSDKHCTYIDYNLLTRTNITRNSSTDKLPNISPINTRK